jgi:proline dehydrogenase
VTDVGARLIRPMIVRVAHHAWVRRLATGTRPGRAVASRFVAGESLPEAMAVARDLDRRRITSMLDHLGEHAATQEQTLRARQAYLTALGEIADADTLDCAISVKLTQLGLDDGVEVCGTNLAPILEAAAEAGTRVEIDMESHAYVDRTLEVATAAHAEYPKVGLALQAYLRRTPEDLARLPMGMRVRLVKGSYLEPPDVVLTRKREVDRAYARLFSTLLARGHPVGVATHDPALIEGARRRVDSLPEGWSRVEFQMLYGVRRDLQASLARDGYPVRVYVPYGTEWYPYLTRRLAERPANLWFFASNLLRSSSR